MPFYSKALTTFPDQVNMVRLQRGEGSRESDPPPLPAQSQPANLLAISAHSENDCQRLQLTRSNVERHGQTKNGPFRRRGGRTFSLGKSQRANLLSARILCAFRKCASENAASMKQYREHLWQDSSLTVDEESFYPFTLSSIKRELTHCI